MIFVAAYNKDITIVTDGKNYGEAHRSPSDPPSIQREIGAAALRMYTNWSEQILQMYGYPSYCIARIDNAIFVELAGRAYFEAGLLNRAGLWKTVSDFSEPLHFDIVAYATNFNEIIRHMRELSGAENFVL